ncbi:MAG: NUDIX domain-containing protein [Alphaproteobacteria bacterium]|nr:NUDIX domain-containing protein [Alphaproteobacteria bacterium]
MSDISDRVRIEKTDVLSQWKYKLERVTFRWRRSNGEWQEQTREAYDRGNGAAILLYDPKRRTVVLVKQFRLPTYLNGYREELIEVTAGLLDNASPEERIAKEAEEETGYMPQNVRKVFATFMSPGSVTEILHLFVGEYAARMGEGGGIAEEGEDIAVLELSFDEAYAMIGDGRIVDAKTIMLLQYAKLHIFD